MINYIQEALSLMQDLIQPANPHEILMGNKLFRPFLSYQKKWLQYCYPQDELTHEHDSWFYLQHYLMPMIKQRASSYHIKGIIKLGLDTKIKPDFNEFQWHFAEIAHGFTIEPVDKEISPKEYFELIHQRRFPCIERMRDKEELFCANEPDFWHEAIGHIAPLCFQEVQECYIKIASQILAAETEEDFNRHVAVAWTVLEYGFLYEVGQYKMFGAALVGSHLAHMRYQEGLINVEPADRTAILNSRFYEEDVPFARNEKGQFRFFGLRHLNALELFNTQ